MSDSMLAAIIAASAAISVALLNSIAAEIFKRHKDRLALAAALAGELSSYTPAFPILQQALNATIEAVDSGRRDTIHLRPFERPKDVVFEKVIEKLGLLGPDLVEQVDMSTAT